MAEFTKTVADAPKKNTKILFFGNFWENAAKGSNRIYLRGNLKNNVGKVTLSPTDRLFLYRSLNKRAGKKDSDWSIGVEVPA